MRRPDGARSATNGSGSDGPRLLRKRRTGLIIRFTISLLLFALFVYVTVTKGLFVSLIAGMIWAMITFIIFIFATTPPETGRGAVRRPDADGARERSDGRSPATDEARKSA